MDKHALMLLIVLFWFCHMSTKITIFFLLLTLCCSIKWLALHHHHHNLKWNLTFLTCSTMSDILTHQQIDTCLRISNLMPYVVRASIDTLSICQYLFVNSRWNCSSLIHAPNFNPDLMEGTREQAFVHSLASSALLVNMARACSSGHIAQCHCRSMSYESNFKWTGCGNNIVHARKLAHLFVSASSSDDDKYELFKGEVNDHNYAVGGEIARKSVHSVCKCHGTSGSCNFKTCWKVIDDLRVIGHRLFERFLVAVRVRFRKQTNGSFRLVPVKSERIKSKKIKLNDLVFRSISSDYCLPDPSLGSVGTKGRHCKKEATGPGRCESMCCGRGFKTVEEMETIKCRCKYYWCCYVKCEACHQVVEVNTCR